MVSNAYKNLELRSLRPRLRKLYLRPLKSNVLLQQVLFRFLYELRV